MLLPRTEFSGLDIISAIIGAGTSHHGGACAVQ
jgi:hypothetical protein